MTILIIRRQEIKLLVRDEILKNLSNDFSDIKTRDEAIKILENKLPEIKRISENKTKSEGREYPVTVKLEKERFPVKTYGAFRFPAGSYTALKVFIGKAEGKNWWCVVFPPLCTQEALSPDAAETLSRQDRALITRAGGEYEIRFRILELWDMVREKLEG